MVRKINDAIAFGLGISAQRITGNVIVGAITDKVDMDVRFDPMANISVTWNDAERRFDFTADNDPYITHFHLADRTTTLQIGANEGENIMALHFGDVSVLALGLQGLLMTSQETAARSLPLIDSAVDRVSGMMVKLDAYRNRLENTITNLTKAVTKLTTSRIRISAKFTAISAYRTTGQKRRP